MHAEGNNRQVFSQAQCLCFYSYCMSSQTGDLACIFIDPGCMKTLNKPRSTARTYDLYAHRAQLDQSVIAYKHTVKVQTDLG